MGSSARDPETGMYELDSESFWKNKMTNCTERCDFSGIFKDSASPESEIQLFIVSGTQYTQLKRFCTDKDLKLPIFLQFAWHNVLNIYGNGNQTIVGLKTGRTSTLTPVILDMQTIENTSIHQVIHHIEDEIKQNSAHPWTQGISGLQFDSLFAYVEDTEVVTVPTKPVLALIVREFVGSLLSFNVSFIGQLVDSNILNDMLSVMNTIILQILENPDMPIHCLNSLPSKQEELMVQWNNTNASFPSTKRLHHLFEEAVLRTPTKIAVVNNEIQLTYQELNCRANQLAHHIHFILKVKPEQFIALFLDKSEITIITVLGIWKSGAAYVPIDPTYPDERVKFMLQDCKAGIAITNEHHAKRLIGLAQTEYLKEIIEIESLLANLNQLVKVDNLDLGLTSNQLAYVTYTSGTTGVPKGVFKEHKGVVNSITDLSAKYGMITDQPEAVVLFAAYVFEPFVRQSLMALINSHKIVIVSDDEKLDQEKFPAFLRKHGITYLNGTASVLQEYDLKDCPSLIKLVLVGEEFTEARYRKLRKTYSGRIITEYGFTESALVTAMKIFDLQTPRIDRTIGKPLRNVKCYVLDKHLQPVPLWAIGELYIGGTGISRGYLNRDELTAERFLENPFQTETEKADGSNFKMYKTGDLARWLPSGEVEYIGRTDFQIKLRGIRIEPGEIESLVLKYPGINKCVVLVKCFKSADESSKHLLGYYVCSVTGGVSEAKLTAYLETQLPQYMMPTRMIEVQSIPVNVNGKVDHRALPDVKAKTGSKNNPAGPRNQLDSKLCQIWSSVLGISLNDTAIQNDFFRLGGHSITCIQLIARIRQELGLTVSLEMIFTLRTIEKISDFLSQQHSASPNQMNHEIPSTCRANSLQQGLLYHHLKQGTVDDAYIMQSLYEYKTELSVETMHKAWEIAQKRYPALRLRFHWENEGVQEVDNFQVLDWRFQDLSNQENIEIAIQQLMQNDRREGFCLQASPLFRVQLIKQDESKYSLIFSYHHIIMDGWSIPILFQFVHETYFRLLQNSDKIDESEETAYLESQSYLQAHREEHIEYWSNAVDRIGTRCDLSGLINESKRTHLTTYDRVQQPKEKILTISTEITKLLRTIIVRHGVTTHSVLQFVWHKVLQVYGNGSHSVVGTTVSGRNLPINYIENSIGLFINTLPLIVDHEQQQERSVLEAIQDIQVKVNEMNSKSNVELGRLKNKGELKHGLFDTIFVLENYPNLDSDQAESHKAALGFKHVCDVEKLDYPLAVVARELDTTWTFKICYAGELFDDTTIDNLLELTQVLLNQVHSKLEQPVSSLDLISPNDLLKLEAWNRTTVKFPMQETLHYIFETCVEKFPNKIAVIYEEVKLNYIQLNTQANQLAHHLRSLIKIKPGTIIALLMDKSHLMMVSILGIWKSGAAYVPIDPSYPNERIQFMLEDTQAQVVITNSLEYTSDVGTLHVIDISNFQAVHGSTISTTNPCPISCSTDLAYVIYTSGTTGKPKGVMIEHRGVVNLQKSLAKIFGLNDSSNEVLLSFSNYVFDHCVEQMTDALLNGQTLVVLNDDMRTDKERLYRYMKDNKVTYLSGTPSVLSLYEYTGLNDLRRIDAVGEDFSEPLFNKIRSTFNGLVINGYGPTEVSITTHKRLYPDPSERRLNKSIGFPVSNTLVYVLNKHMQRVPVGAVGELYLGGIGVGRGYLNRADLTEKQFLPNPFNEGRIYKTGDLVRFLPNGELECLGRNDFQVKIRGLRIELCEIEAVISSYPGITHSVVIARQVLLIGYYVSSRPITESELKNFVQSKLPQHMIPNRLIQIPEIPVTINGKVDTRALECIDISKFTGQSENVNSPLSEIQFKLISIWAELLKLPDHLIGIQDDFFGLGGDSLMATTLSFMLTKAFGRGISVAQVFKMRTIEQLSQYISNGGVADIKQIKTVPGDQLVSLAQERLLFIDEMEGGTHAFNIQFVLKFPVSVNIDILVRAVKAMLARHESLRTLIQDSSQIVQTFEQALEIFHIGHVRVPDLDHAIAVLPKHVFNLETELPFKSTIYYVESEADSFYVAFLFHHICFDGWSWLIFKRDLRAFYEHYTGKHLKLPATGIKYKDYSAWQRNQFADGRRLKPLLDYWLKKLDGHEHLNLLTDYPRRLRFDYSGAEIKFELDSDVTEGLKSLAKELKVSLYTVLVSGYCLMLSTYTNQRDIVIGTPSSNRNRSELEGIIGFFVNMLPLRINVNEKIELSNFIQSVSEEIIQSQIHQELPFDKLIKEMNIKTDLYRHPVFQIIFTFDQFNSTDTNSQFTYTNYYPDAITETSVKYDLSATMAETTENGLHGTFTYATKLFRPETVTGFANTYKHVLMQFAELVSKTEQKLYQINRVAELILPATLTGEQIENIWSDGRTLHEIFENMAARSPDSVAIVYGNTQLTYRQLNARSNQLAHHIQNTVSNLKLDDLVGLLLDKSELMFISILGVWKTGAAYVPIDPNYPEERIAFILRDTRAKTVITNAAYAHKLASISKDIHIVHIDNAKTVSEMLKYPKSKIRSNSMQSNLAYVIYTSGTTGTPKGVMIQHGGLVNFRHGLLSLYPEQGQNILFLSNYVFDFSIEQLILSILNSNTLIIPSSDLSIDEEFYDYVNSNRLTYLSGTPTFIQEIDLSRVQHLRRVTVAGEQLTKSHYTKMRREFAGPIANAYGVTETSVYNMVQFFQGKEPYKNCLGQILPNMKGYVLNSDLQPLPIGAVGELCLAGHCLARGYLNKSDLTSQHFVQHEAYGKIYRTGDLVRCLKDGSLEYLGRNDTQVKILGLRVDLREIEAVLGAHPQVSQCAVIITNSNKLSAFYVQKDPVFETELVQYLQQKLPSYMIPNKLVKVDKFHMTVNGKLDIKQLEQNLLTNGRLNCSEPVNLTQTRMCRIWSELLGISWVGLDEDFFRLGGDSILSMRVARQIRTEMKLKVTVKDIFVHRTVRRILANIGIIDEPLVNGGGNRDFKLEFTDGNIPLLPIQKWFFDKELSSYNHWNQNFTVKVPELSLDGLKAAVNVLINHHDAFRLRFKQEYGEFVQFPAEDMVDIPVHNMDIRTLKNHAELSMLQSKWQSRFDIQNGPTACIAYIYGYEDGSALLWFALHHLIVDSVSWRIIKSDFETIYKGGTIDPNDCSYRDWAVALQQYQHTEKERRHWEDLQQKSIEFNDKLNSIVRNTVYTKATFTLSQEDTKMLLQDAVQAYDSEINELLLTGMAYALQTITQLPINYVTLEGHGREEIQPNLDTSNTVGWFTSMYPVELKVSRNLESTLFKIKAELLRIPYHGLGYGLQFGYDKAQLPAVALNYLGQFDSHKEAGAAAWEFTNLTGEYGLDRVSESDNNNLIDVTGLCFDRQLRFNVESLLGNVETERFLGKFEEILLNIIENSRIISMTRFPELDSNFEPYYEFREDAPEDGKILFVLPPGEGGAESYFNNIVNHLTQFKLILFNNYYLNNRHILSTFQDLAKFYIKYVKKLQPQGPYNFLGWSFGGILSLEIARQLSVAGETIDNLFFIDSYFNVKKAYKEIDREIETEIIDRINYMYTPEPSSTRNMLSSVKNIVLFKAGLVNETYISDNQYLLYDYYLKSRFNNLDTVIEPKFIKLFQLANESHGSWVKNSSVVQEMCNFIADGLCNE